MWIYPISPVRLSIYVALGYQITDLGEIRHYATGRHHGDCECERCMDGREDEARVRAERRGETNEG